MPEIKEDICELLLIFKQSINNTKELSNSVGVLEKQNEQLTLLCTALMDTLFLKKTITPTDLEQTISKIVSKGKDNTTVH